GGKRLQPGGIGFLAQGTGVSIEDWSMEFAPSGGTNLTFHYARGGVSGLEEILWKEALDPVADAGIYGAFARAVERNIASYSVGFADDAELISVCRGLREKSLAELSR
ncbi:MAG TPA: hypothetical protein VM598_04080, partial [Bdellovibrionota bacterium]|nr:hypothetical protein [Bdellovibrionota bacterium]